MMPAAIALGDYNNLFSTGEVVSLRPQYVSMRKSGDMFRDLEHKVHKLRAALSLAQDVYPANFVNKPKPEADGPRAPKRCKVTSGQSSDVAWYTGGPYGGVLHKGVALKEKRWLPFPEQVALRGYRMHHQKPGYDLLKQAANSAVEQLPALESLRQQLSTVPMNHAVSMASQCLGATTTAVSPVRQLIDNVHQVDMDYSDCTHKLHRGQAGWGLRVAISDKTSGLLRALDGFVFVDSSSTIPDMIYCPGGPMNTSRESMMIARVFTKNAVPPQVRLPTVHMSRAERLFHHDAEGKSCFTPKEAMRASEHVAAMELDQRVKACLQYKRFILPQQSKHVSAMFCNEAVYGRLNVLHVTGVVKMDHNERLTFAKMDALKQTQDKTAEDTQAHFDAWPSALAKQAAEVTAAAAARPNIMRYALFDGLL